MAWCTCPYILSFLPLAFLPRTRSTHSTCTLGSAWEIWNGYSNCSAWLDWDIDETADCSYPRSINRGIRVFLFIYRTPHPPMCSYTVCFVFVHFFVRVRSTCSMYSTWRTCRASTIKERQHAMVTAFSSSTGNSNIDWLTCLHWQHRAKRHRAGIICPALITKPFSSRLTFIIIKQ